MKPALILFYALLCSLPLTTLAAQGSWSNRGSGKSGSLGVPVLGASAPRLGRSVTFAVAAARPNSLALFVIGLSARNAPVLGGTLVPSTEFLFASKTDARGNASLVISLPNDRKLMVFRPRAQCLIADPLATFGAAFSNALEGQLCAWFRTVEDFQSNLFFDAERSAGAWGGGSLSFSPFGGTGRHGDFDASLGNLVSDPKASPKVYEWDLSKSGGFKIPKTHTASGKDEFVTDGRFYFQKLIVPAGVEVNFVGSIAARITVQGLTRIAGSLRANGEDLPTAGRPGSELARKAKTALRGEKGGRGGAMGGAGGDGGDKGDGVAHKVAFDGKLGTRVQMLPGHLFGSVYAATGGAGSPQFPLNGKNSAIVYSFFSVISQQSNRGGGGGGFTTAGGGGFVKWSGTNKGNQKYAAPGTTAGGKGSPFPAAFPNYTIAFTRQDHYLAGGAGGGGGGASCGGAIKSLSTDRYRIGRAGAGGGGALGLRLGRDLDVLPTGSLEARGGAGAHDPARFSIRGMMTPGGGGSGGALFLQVSGATRNTGSISVAGGRGGVTEGSVNDQVYAGMRAVGGDGSNGILHFETARDPKTYKVGVTVPANPPVARFDAKDQDPVVAVRSRWYPTNLVFRPEFLRYEIEAKVDGKTMTFSDDPRLGPLASGAGSPLRFAVRGATLAIDANGKFAPKTGTTVTPSLDYVGPFGAGKPSLFGSGKNGYRFELAIDRSVGKTVVVKKITVVWCI